MIDGYEKKIIIETREVIVRIFPNRFSKNDSTKYTVNFVHNNRSVFRESTHENKIDQVISAGEQAVKKKFKAMITPTSNLGKALTKQGFTPVKEEEK